MDNREEGNMEENKRFDKLLELPNRIQRKFFWYKLFCIVSFIFLSTAWIRMFAVEDWILSVCLSVGLLLYVISFIFFILFTADIVKIINAFIDLVGGVKND